MIFLLKSIPRFFLMTSQKVVKTDGTVKSFRCKARECLPQAG
jgi:hypothetical protein